MAEAVRITGGSGFRVVAGSTRSQAAEMTLPPGGSTGGPDNRHPDSDQWVYVVSGTGAAIIDHDEHQLSAGTLLLIEAGEAHELKSGPAEPLVTFNVYAPPEY
jgi:mannose-6-phosphate isomerase-like protein (cupin superfamily)